jgi:hypothetical protein
MPGANQLVYRTRQAAERQVDGCKAGRGDIASPVDRRELLKTGLGGLRPPRTGLGQPGGSGRLSSGAALLRSLIVAGVERSLGSGGSAQAINASSASPTFRTPINSAWVRSPSTFAAGRTIRVNPICSASRMRRGA